MLSALLFTSVAADMVKLASFGNDADPKLKFKWIDTNDPVMGGQSVSTFEIKDNLGVFNGTCKIVPSLSAPGFDKITTQRSLTESFNDVSKFIDGGFIIRAKTTTPDYAGFRLAFAAKGVPKTSIFGGGSFKSGFNMTSTTDFQNVFIPFDDFSYDWSGYTGTCTYKDPSGQQHHCCAKTDSPLAGPKYCPTAKFLGEITDLEVWAEGAEGNFHIEIDYIAAGDAAPGPAPGPAPAGKTIVDLAVATPDLSTLVTALKAGKLVDTLNGPGPFTVFAPTNEAFAKLPKALLDHLLDPANIKELDDVLTYHVALGSVHSTDLKNKENIKTVEGKDVEVFLYQSHVYIIDAEVITANVDASNGVVHIVDHVLIPPRR